MSDFGWEELKKEEKIEILKGIEEGSCNFYPKTIEIDWTDRCNFDCYFCSQKGFIYGDELGLEIIENLFNEMDEMNVKSLQVSGGGEPLFHKDIEKIFDLIRKKSFSLNTFTTNGVLLNERLAENLIDITKKQITLSLNFSSEEEYKKYHKTSGKNFYKTLENLKCLVEYKMKKGNENPKIALQLFVYDESLGKLNYMLEMAYNLKVDIVAFNPIFIYKELSKRIRERKEEFLKEVEEVFKNDVKELICSLLTPYPEINEEISKIKREKFPSKYKEWNVKEKNFSYYLAVCPMPWFLMHIKANGNVYPCCVLLKPDFSPLGNVKNNFLKFICFNKSILILEIHFQNG